MLPEQRRREILEYMTRQGAADVAALADEFAVSIATIRRDLQLLHERGNLTRTHGGAISNYESASFEPFHQDKAQLRTAQKAAIANVAAALVDDGEVVILDSGSTTLALAGELRKKKGLTVITTDLKIALELSDVPGFEVVIAGGVVRPQLYSVVGPVAERTLSELHANHSFLGADAIDLDAGVTNASLSEVAVKRFAIAGAEQTVLLADHSKFERRSLTKVAKLSEFGRVICDGGLPSSLARRYSEAGVNLTLAEVK